VLGHLPILVDLQEEVLGSSIEQKVQDCRQEEQKR